MCAPVYVLWPCTWPRPHRTALALLQGAHPLFVICVVPVAPTHAKDTGGISPSAVLSSVSPRYWSIGLSAFTNLTCAHQTLRLHGCPTSLDARLSYPNPASNASTITWFSKHTQEPFGTGNVSLFMSLQPVLARIV